VYCWIWVHKQLQDALDSDQQLKECYGSVTLLYNALLHAALCWGSNRQSPNPKLRGKPGSTSETSGNCGIINGFDQEHMIEVGKSADRVHPAFFGLPALFQQRLVNTTLLFLVFQIP
jgi:hypothetical protein